MTAPYSYKDGRVWLQQRKFQPFGLLLPYGLTSITDPVGSLAAVREPSASRRRATEVVDILRSEPELPGFTVETRLKKSLNFMFGLKNCQPNFQAHLGACGRPDNYYASEMALDWERCLRADMSIDRVAIIEGDNAPIATQVPWMAQIGPHLIDFNAQFLSARSITEGEAISDVTTLSGDCDGCEDIGDNVYAVTEALSGSPTNVANVWLSRDKGETWAETSTRPLPAGESISAVIAQGSEFDHRVAVFSGTTDVDDPAHGAYSDVSIPGTTNWVPFNIGIVDGQYVIYAYWLDWSRALCVTNDGFVYKSNDGCVTWTAKLTTAAVQLNDIKSLPNGTVWVVGATNTIYMSSDHGESWTQITGPSGGGNLTTLTVTPDGTVIIGDDAGVIYGTANQGREWHTLSLQGVNTTSVKRLRVSPDSNQVIWAAVDTDDEDSVGRVLRSTDGGATFRLWSLGTPTNQGLNALHPVDLNMVFVAGEPQDNVAFITRTMTNVIGIELLS